MFPVSLWTRLSLCSKQGVDYANNRPLIHAPPCLHCGEAILGRKGKGGSSWGSRVKASRVPFPLCIRHIAFGLAPHRKTVCVQTSPFSHWCKQRKLCMSFLPFDDRRHPPLFLMLLACIDILNSLIKCKNYLSVLGKSTCIDTCQELHEIDTHSLHGRYLVA